MSFDATTQLVLAWDKKLGRFTDKTQDIVSLAVEGSQYVVRYRNTRFPFKYNAQNVSLGTPGESQDVPSDSLVEVGGKPWSNVTRLQNFSTAAGPWTRVHYTVGGAGAFRSYPAGAVRIVASAREQPRVAQLMDYFGQVVEALPADDPLKNSYKRLGFVHPDSALAAFLAGASLEPVPGPSELIYPFSSNLSQIEAITQCLTRQISVIEGPPGTGKTQTILNLIANLVRDPSATVGVVSFNNAAVDNVYDKLTQYGFGFIAAPMGSRAKLEDFVAGQEARNAELKDFLAAPRPRSYEPEQLAHLSSSVHRVYVVEREAAHLRAFIAQLDHESQQFQMRFPQAADAPALPPAAARWTSSRLLELLAEIELAQFHKGGIAKIRWRFRRRFRYRVSGAIDVRSPEFALELQRQYFATRRVELQQALEESNAELQSPELAPLRERVGALSLEILKDTVRQRYEGREPSTYAADMLWRQRDAFARDYPVLLSTCHSLPTNVGPGRLLDYLIIDEASQVNLAVGVLAMSVAKRVIVVGDTRQLPHIAADVGGIGTGTGLEAYDYGQHSVLSSLVALHGDELPSTMLREHYRCDPRIIDFCNRKFYGGKLIPMRAERQGPALALVRTAPGEHSRSHVGGGHTNQREVDVLVREALPQFCGAMSLADVGVVTPFRKQADLIAEQLPGVEADTVHKFQGREKRAILMSSLIDASHSDTRLATFVDDPHLINVAVSRAQDSFILVASPDLPSECQHLRDLVGYIEQRSPGHVVNSEIVSVFDLLYTDYAATLRSMATRLTGSVPYRSEEAALVMLRDLLDADELQHLRLNYQVLLHQLLPANPELTRAEATFVRNRASADFVISNRTTDQVLAVIEVDGFTYHQDDPEQLRRDGLKDSLLSRNGIQMLRLPTTGSGEVALVTEFLARMR